MGWSRKSPLLDEIVSKTVHKDTQWSEPKHKIKSAEFSGDKSCAKGNPSNKLQDYEYEEQNPSG